MSKMEFEALKIRTDKSVKEAMKQMDKTGLKILFVVNKEDALLGTITDGDFRKWILAGNSTEPDISEVYNKAPVKCGQDYDLDGIKKMLIEKRMEAVPIVDEKERIVNVLFWEEVFGANKRLDKNKRIDVPVVIMAGGEGARMSPFTKILPKPLLPFGDKPIMEIIMDNFSDFGCAPFYLILGHKAGMVKAYFDNAGNDYSPTYKFENENELRGTAGGLTLLLDEDLPGSFFVSNCDVVIKADYSDIYDFHIKKECDITVVSAMRHFVIPYGVTEMSTGGNMRALTEKPEFDFLVNTGMYIMKKEAISLIPDTGVYHFTDLLKKVQEKGGKVSIYPVSEKSWFDFGQLSLWDENVAYFAEQLKKNGEI